MWKEVAGRGPSCVHLNSDSRARSNRPGHRLGLAHAGDRTRARHRAVLSQLALDIKGLQACGHHTREPPVTSHLCWS